MFFLLTLNWFLSTCTHLDWIALPLFLCIEIVWLHNECNASTWERETDKVHRIIYTVDTVAPKAPRHSNDAYANVVPKPKHQQQTENIVRFIWYVLVFLFQSFSSVKITVVDLISQFGHYTCTIQFNPSWKSSISNFANEPQMKLPSGLHQIWHCTQISNELPNLGKNLHTHKQTQTHAQTTWSSLQSHKITYRIGIATVRRGRSVLHW